jgi:uncharacterized integral membrane protein
VVINAGAIRAKNRAARWITEALQPPVVVTVQLLISPLTQPGFPGTMTYGALAAVFVCVIPLILLLVLVRHGKVTDHHVSDRKQRAPVLLMALGSIVAGLLVLTAAGAPESVVAMVLAVVGGVVVLAGVSPLWKISGHAAAIASSTVIAVPDARPGMASGASARPRCWMVPGGAARPHGGTGGCRFAVLAGS